MTPMAASVFQKAAQFARARWVFQLAKGLGFNLPDPFARYAELLAHFLKRMVGIHANPETHPQHAFLTRGQAGQNARCGFA